MIKKIAFILLVLLAGACSTYHSRLFLLDEIGTSLKGLYIFPTIVAYENLREVTRDYYGDNDFWVEIRVADTLTRFPGRLLEVGQDDPRLVEVRSKFRQRVMTTFAVDTITVICVPPIDSADTIEAVDTVAPLEEIRYVLPAVIDVPGWKWQLIFRFKSVEIPPLVDNLQIVVPFTQFDSTSNQFLRDTLYFSMHRYESHEKSIWAKDIPKNFR